VIAATNRDPRAAVREGRLREDLLYRLCVVPLRVPALRDRDCDALLLAQRFLDAHNRECGIRKRLAASMRERIAAHPWPGNVRELRNAVHRAFVLSDDEIDVDLELPTVRSAAPAEVAAGERPSLASTVAVQVGVTLAEAEQALILATLDAVNGSKAQAAKLLGISIKTLYNRLQAYRGPPAPPRMPSNRWPLAAAA
jgi:two-component system response regulator HydG